MRWHKVGTVYIASFNNKELFTFVLRLSHLLFIWLTAGFLLKQLDECAVVTFGGCRCRSVDA